MRAVTSLSSAALGRANSRPGLMDMPMILLYPRRDCRRRQRCRDNHLAHPSHWNVRRVCIVAIKVCATATSRMLVGWSSGWVSHIGTRAYPHGYAQGLHANQQVTFFSDGGDTLHEVAEYLNPQ